MTMAVFLTLPLAMLVVFPVLFGAALWWRRRSDFHKRLVLIATLELVTAAVARWPGVLTLGPIAFFGITDLFLVALAVYDWRTRGRVHPATLWGGAFLVASQPLRFAVGFTPAWAAFTSWLLT
jgi:phosphoglycerol transferase MdoB-like AlkP superfamily enzyme